MLRIDARRRWWYRRKLPKKIDMMAKLAVAERCLGFNQGRPMFLSPMGRRFSRRVMVFLEFRDSSVFDREDVRQRSPGTSGTTPLAGSTYGNPISSSSLHRAASRGQAAHATHVKR
nr:hypothetical protein [Paraburkholderia tuberum]